MALIKWRDEFALGISSIDHEHQQLIALINDLHDDLGRPNSLSTVPYFLGELYAEISAHFALEEKLMHDHAYEHYEAHKTDHERLLDDILDLMDSYESGEDIDIDAFADRLKHWFTDHFRTHDARLHRRLG